MRADIIPADRGEDVSLMEPTILSSDCRDRSELTDLALKLAQKSASLRSSLPAHLVESIAALVRGMNCYYSNLIEGHDTHPVDIERALRNDYSHDPHKRDLQLEANAHIKVQHWIDTGGLAQQEIISAQTICEMHSKFCELLPDTLLLVKDPITQEQVRVVPGEYRKKDVKVGLHLAVSPRSIPRFMNRFEDCFKNLSRTDSIISAAAAHHRFLWIHPFTDGNGRVARLISHATLLRSLDSGALWSVARGLARSSQEYKRLLAGCDMTRRNSLDGRGNLSEEALVEFTKFFLKTAIDQVEFMESLLKPEGLQSRIAKWAQNEAANGSIPTNSPQLLEAILYRGQIARNEVPGIIGTGDRQARRVVALLTKRNILQDDGPKLPIRLNFPAELASHWMPGLFPEKIQG